MLKIEKKGAFGHNSVKSIYSLMEDIDFNPPYQRHGNVWSIDKKQLLIDSIINSYDLPKFYLHYITLFNPEINKSEKSYAIIDGKQRLQTIKDFLDNKLKISPNLIYEKDPTIQIANFTYKEIGLLYPEIKYDIDNFELDIVYIITDEIDKIEELFYRLNEGKPLNSAEKRNRIVGYVNNSIKEIISHNAFFTSRFIYANSRLQYEDLCLKLLLIEDSNELLSFTKNRMDKFVTDNRKEKKHISDAIERLKSNLELLNNIFIENDSLLKSRSIIPVYYYFITRERPLADKVRPFLIWFNRELAENRQSDTPNSVLNDFDLQNQQATHTKKSLEYRFYVLKKYYERYND